MEIVIMDNGKVVDKIDSGYSYTPEHRKYIKHMNYTFEYLGLTKRAMCFSDYEEMIDDAN